MEDSKSNSNIITIQKDAIKHKVTEAMVAEAKRKKLLADGANNFSPKRIKELERRHEEERLRDQEIIEFLVSDLDIIQQKVADGSLNPTNRSKCTKAKPIQTMKTDRFHRQILYQDYSAAKEYTEVMQHIDEETKRRSTMKTYNEYQEKRKLGLLLQKQEVLHRLAAVTRAHLCSAGIEDTNQTNAQSYSYALSHSDRASTAHTDTSKASWATFGSRRAGSSQEHVGRQRPHHVPALKLT